MRRENLRSYNVTVFQKPLVDDRYDKPWQILLCHCLQMIYYLGTNPSCIFTPGLFPHLWHCSEVQSKPACLAKLHFCQKFNTLAQDPSSGKRQTLCPVRLGGIPWAWELIGHLEGERDCWPTMVMPLIELVLPNCLLPVWFPLPTWHSNSLTNSLSQLVLGTLGKVYLVSPSTHILARQEVQMNVTRAF